MATGLNKVMLIGRLAADPETRTFASGGKVANIRFVVNNRKKNSKGEWEDDPVWLDVKAFDRENGRKTASLCEQCLKKGSQVFLEGKLHMEQWEDKNGGGRRTKLVVVLDDVQFLDKREEAREPVEARGPAKQQTFGGYDPSESPF